MIRRPLTTCFNDPVFQEIKTTTIRRKPWPVGVPIMFYNWQGPPYRAGSRQINVAPIIVLKVVPITIGSLSVDDRQFGRDGTIFYTIQKPFPIPVNDLWKSEGFKDRHLMDQWFSKFVPKPGDQITQYIHHFRLWTCGDNDRYFTLHGKLP